MTPIESLRAAPTRKVTRNYDVATIRDDHALVEVYRLECGTIIIRHRERGKRGTTRIPLNGIEARRLATALTWLTGEGAQ